MAEDIRKTIPFLRWAGGKVWLTRRIDKYLPQKFNDYYEPFLGGASIFTHLSNKGLIKKRAFLSDSNQHLISCYKELRDNPKAIIRELKKYKNTADEYYSTRGKSYNDPIKNAARFIYLNRTSFNGIYRENLQGQYNVPYGYKDYKELFDFDNLLQFSISLQEVDLRSHDFGKALLKVKKGDFVFLDPPYTVAHENNGFVKYNQKIFSWDDQIRLRKVIIDLIDNGVHFILTNAYHASIKELYKNVGKQEQFERASVVGGAKSVRDRYHEIMITNVDF